MMAPVIVVGGGGHSQVVIEALLSQGIEIIGYTDLLGDKGNRQILNIGCLGDDDAVLSFHNDEILLANGIGSVGDMAKRKTIFEGFKKKSYNFASVIHATAVVAADTEIGEGTQILAGAIVQTGARIGANSIVNSGSIVEHHCLIGEHCHVSPGAVLAGKVALEDGIHVGVGATIIQGMHLGARCLVAAGAAVIEDVPADGKVGGVPARQI